jgi:hypothetical protein
LPLLPLLLWDTPPGLGLILAQDGVAHRRVTDPHPLAFRGGRFVLYDGREVPASAVRARLSPEHVAIDVDTLREGFDSDPFDLLLDTSGALARWEVAGRWLTERVARHAKAPIRRRLLERLRHAVTSAGGTWVRLGAFPFPYRSAFNFRADLDETCVSDYARFARARRPLADCCTHFVSTHAYGDQPAVLADLRRLDTQSHGHYHVIYRSPDANRRNLVRAHKVLRDSGFEPVGFAAPHGRWNPGLDRAIEELGYAYSSDFQVGHDDLPFFPWRGDRFSRVLQVPIHPVCEGLFFDAGEPRSQVVAEYLVGVVRAKVDACEPAFVYGHPEGRLGRRPEILAAVAEAVSGEPLLWRVTLTEFAHWWRWRGDRTWSVVPRPGGRLEVQFDDWSVDFPLALEVVRGCHVGSLPAAASRTVFRLEDLAYERRLARADIADPVPLKRRPSVRAAIRTAIDWETITPLEDLPAETLPERVKKGLRLWRDRRRGEGAR